MNFLWKYSARGSVWYAAWRWLAGRRDPRWQHIAPWCEALTLTLPSDTDDPRHTPRALFAHLLTAAADEPRDGVTWVPATLARFFQDMPDGDAAGEAVASMVVDMTDQLATVALESELLLRVGPLREQWEARGPGMLHFLRKRLWPDLPAETLTVLCVDPVGGQGGGVAFAAQPIVACEALLTNIVPNLPEVVRLAWLAAHRPALQAGSSAAVDGACPPTLLPPATLLIPAVLQAAEYVELTACDLPTLRLALSLWSELPTAEAAADTTRTIDEVAERLWDWWSDPASRSAGWRDALNRYNQRS